MNNLKKIKNIFLISSGKGGVGKSTVAVNLTISLAREGYKTGILDADFYGPSIPIALGLEGERVEIRQEENQEKIIPLEKYGIKVMSLGFLMNREDAVIWRGPMAANALTQIIENTYWEELDYLVIDMPPGTGDIPLTIVQKIPQAKSIIVITPQDIAIADGIKAIKMYNSTGINIPIVGVVENMSYFIPEKHPDEKYYIFGKDGGKKLAENYNLKLLTQIPLVKDVCENTDNGKSIFNSENKELRSSYALLVDNILAEEHVKVCN